jgi:hypothetical protein
MPLAIIENLSIPKNLHLGPQNGPEVKTAKNSKLPKLPENCFEPVGRGGWPLDRYPPAFNSNIPSIK